MKSSAKKVELASVDDLFTTEQERQEADEERVVRIPLTQLHYFKGYGRMIEIYLVTSVAPIPMAAMMGKEWGGMGQNYLRSLLALGFQAFLIIVCVAIYAVLVQGIATEEDVIMAIWSCVGYTVLLCFTLFKTGSLAKAVFQAH